MKSLPLVEFCRAPYQVVMKVPDGVSLLHAAGIREYIINTVIINPYNKACVCVGGGGSERGENIL